MSENGWLLDENEENDSFLFVWVDDESDGTESVTAALILRDKIIDYLENIGWTKDKLLKKAEEIRNNPYSYMRKSI